MSAWISDCGRYRYRLSRDESRLNNSPAVFVMLNPSTADAETDDATIRKCRGFAKRWWRYGIVVANLYAFRATNPKALLTASDPVGPDNDKALEIIALDSRDIVCAWGSNAEPGRARNVCSILRRHGATLWCLGRNKNGSPKHPLYVPYDKELEPFCEEPENG